MARPKGLPKTGGRQKGSPNKTTLAARQAMALAFEGIGGVDNLVEWANNNQTEFYKIYARMIPLEVTGQDGGALQAHLKVSFVSS